MVMKRQARRSCCRGDRWSMTWFRPSWSNRRGTLPRLLFLLIAVLALFTVAEAQKKSSCIECHRRLDDPRLSTPAKLFANDIHGSRGLSCNDCHGGCLLYTSDAADERSSV